MLRLVGRFLPQILVGLAITGIMLAAYASAGLAYAASPKATWVSAPLDIGFAAATGTGSAPGSFTCSPSISDITLRVIVSNPLRMSLTATPSSFSFCGSASLAVRFTAHCLVSATLCKGSYQGLVQIREPGSYRDIPANEKIVITVTVT